MIACGDVPHAKRTDGGHWVLVDSDDLKKWVAKKALQFQRKREMQAERFRHKERCEKWAAEMQESMPACLAGRLVNRGAVLERRLDRQIRDILKTLDSINALDSIRRSHPSYRVPALVDALKTYSESWQRADGAV